MINRLRPLVYENTELIATLTTRREQTYIGTVEFRRMQWLHVRLVIWPLNRWIVHSSVGRDFLLSPP